MKRIIASLAVALICFSALSVPAKRGLVKFTQPDGTVIFLQKHGDEFCHWVTDSSGQVVEKGSDGFWRPAGDSSMLSRRRAAAIAKRSARNRSYRAGQHVALGQKRFLVILVEFQDVQFASGTARQDFHDMMNQSGYSANGATGSAKDYYYDNSHGLFEPVFDVYGPVKLDNNVAYYGGNDSSGDDLRPEQAVKQACQKLDEQIDFSHYDNDNDGEVDLVFMYYAGFGEADYGDEDTIWPHQWELSYGGASINLDGKKVDKYACTNELVKDAADNDCMCGVGTSCHEFGHAMGLPDFYDVDYDTNGYCMAMFDYSIMCGGSYNNGGKTPPYFTIEERILLGWLDESALREFTGSGQLTITSVDDNVAYITRTDQDGEYFVYECRGQNGWDAHLPAFGLVVTHVDKSSRTVTISGKSYTAKSLWDNWTSTNSLNASGSHPCCYVVPAAGQTDLKFGYMYFPEYEGYYFNSSYNPKIPFPGSSKVSDYSAVSWNGVTSDVSLSGISYANNQVSFYVKVLSDDIDYNVIDNPGNGVYTAGDNFELKLINSETSPVSSVAWYFDDEPVSGPSVRLRAGNHTVEAVVTLGSGETQTVTLEITVQ